MSKIVLRKQIPSSYTLLQKYFLSLLFEELANKKETKPKPNMKKHFIMGLCLMATLISFSSCKQTEKEQPKYITDVQAHRGGMGLLPANTLEAMKNAVDEAKAVADYITENDNNHDGIAEIIDRLILKGEK